MYLQPPARNMHFTSINVLLSSPNIMNHTSATILGSLMTNLLRQWESNDSETFNHTEFLEIVIPLGITIMHGSPSLIVIIGMHFHHELNAEKPPALKQTNRLVHWYTMSCTYCLQINMQHSFSWYYTRRNAFYQLAPSSTFATVEWTFKWLHSSVSKAIH